MRIEIDIMTQNVALKLSLPPPAMSALRQHPIIAGAMRLGDVAMLKTVYYDTPNQRLRARKIEVGIQCDGTTCVQTIVRYIPSSYLLSIRSDWTQPYEAGFDFSQIDDAELARLLTRYAPRLTPVGIVQSRRQSYRYASRAGVSILMTIDQDEIEAGGYSTTIGEFALVAETGDGLDLLALSDELARTVPLIPEDSSKVERCYRLLDERAVQPMRAKASEITADQSLLDACQTLAQACVRQWQFNTMAATQPGGEQQSEFIHQVRVGLRRLRSVLKVFEPVLPSEFASYWQGRLRENAGHFDAARDLDVFQAELLEPVLHVGLVNQDGFARLLEKTENARRAAHEATRLGLDAARQGHLILEFTSALRRLTASNAKGDQDLRTFAKRRLSRLRKRGRLRFVTAEGGQPAQLHQLRIGMKELRYATEFFAPLFPNKAVGRYLDHLAFAQDTLGFIQDLEVARTRIEAWTQDDPSLGTAVGFVLGWHAPRYTELCRRVLHDCGPILWGKVPWEGK